MQTAQKHLLYLYCVTKVKPDQNTLNDNEIKAYSIYSQGIYAIVGNVSEDEFGEENLKKNLADIKWVEKKIRQHEKIIEEIMKAATVVPFKFATVFHTEKNIEKMLSGRNMEFKRAIADLDDKEEWGIKIYCSPEKFRAGLEEKDKSLKEKDAEINAAGKGKAYFLRKKKEELLKDIMNQKISEYTQDSFERLKMTSMETRINKILSKEVTEKKDNMVFNAAFLIRNERVKDFKHILEYLVTKYSDRGLTIECSGPWPPYNFCRFSVKDG